MSDTLHGTAARPQASESLAESAYKRLREDIIRGVRYAGERLRIEKLKGIYGMGPTPLREALQRLSSEQFVEVHENRGFTVAPMDLADFGDLNFARAEIEQIALRRAMRIGDGDWEARVVAASYVMAKADARLADIDGPRHDDDWEKANAAFHSAMVSACDSRWLLMTRGRLQDMCERYRRASLHTTSGHRSTAQEHTQISEAVLARDVDRACALTAAHFTVTLNILLEERSGHDPVFAPRGGELK
ncbi:MAG: FCD domain-containing protein [Comamonadaceae bacterium]|jgi:GntR family transcriptional regulator, carbon starvation induced regulator|tara:strand:+ start:4062 stop:4799 length:738 start_codon:yes stop_codon:yes gene_type:complete